MTETLIDYTVELTPELTELEQLNLKVAAIAGWTDIQEWHRSLNPHPDLKVNKNVFIGTNDKYPELGTFVPDYTSDLNAIVAVLKQFKVCYRFTYIPVMEGLGAACRATTLTRHSANAADIYADTEAIALCKLLLELAPNLPKPEPEIQVIDDDSEID
jgi:hypothetical protein